MFATARDKKEAVIVRPSTDGVDGVLIGDLRRPPTVEAFVVPLLVRGRPVAILYADVRQTLDLEAVEAVTAFAKSVGQGFEKLILTHPYDKAPGLTLEQVHAVARPHVRIEFVFCSITPHWAFTDAATIAHCIRSIGPARFVISSDGGQAHNPMPAEGYRRFVDLLHAEGIAKDDFRVMCRENGDYLLHG